MNLSLKIDHRTIRIEAMEHSDIACGYFLDHEGLIQIDHTIQPEQQADTLIHEVLHAIWRSRGLPDRATEEEAVNRLASGLATVLRDNPDLPLWLEQALHEGVPIVGVPPTGD